ncbi:His Kinase A (phospho-acceptor) domain-containing protein [Paenibacillus sp. 1_12]|uniref:ATP-binding protein n=1 Tax=Paenibacillus sp. 1_12 TaxID=1566278 RepID=UPI0008E76908|nr:ATP-binding protein [Paenibacillus sp. 1_12]SFL00863.1 His Kinase A (phospho-acceptor) domain-containing protein [Paenibacillus sp. 1_12]
MLIIWKDHFLQGIFALTLIILLVALQQITGARETPAAEHGVLDLRGWDLTKTGIFSLDGEWEFYPHQLLSPAEIHNAQLKSVMIHVPGNWENEKINKGTKMSGKGYGTYRLVIRNIPIDQTLAISKRYIRFSDALYVDGKLLGQSGIPGISLETYEPRNVPYTVYFRSDAAEIEIVLQAANFDFRSGGIFSSIEFGLGPHMENKKIFQTGLELVVMGFLLLFGLLFLYLFFHLHRDILQLLHAFFFFSFAVIVFTNGERMLLQMFPDLSFELAFKIKYISVYIMPMLVFLIISKIVTNRRMRIGLMVISSFHALYCLLIAITPFRFYSNGQESFYVMSLLTFVAASAFLFHQYASGKYGSITKPQFQLLIASVWTLFLSSMLTILNTWNLISIALSNMTVLFILMAFALLLVYQYVRAYDSMQQLTRKLQIADRMKDEFLLLTSHELNSPLHSIIHLSRSLLETPVRRPNEAEIREKLQIIRNTAYRMSNLVNDLIDISRFKDGSLKIIPGMVDLVSCISVVIDVFGFLATAKGIVLERRIEPEARYVIADESRLLQVLYNLVYHIIGLQNNGEILFECRQDNGCVQIMIRHDARRVVLTHNEMKESSTSMDVHSVAAGLSIATELVKLMGGKLVINDSVGTMQIALPSAALEDTEAAATAFQEEGPLKAGSDLEDLLGSPSATILIATTDLVDMEQLNSLLTTEGFRVAFASSDVEVQTAITQRGRLDLIILDVMLPSVTGFEVCKRIRLDFSQAELPVLFVNTRSTPVDIESCIAAGGNDFITRPLDAGEILVRVHTLLGMKRLVKEAADNEMAFLRSQIKPHFLYNALGTIMSLCYTDGPRAGELLGSFSRYLRILFHLDNSEETIPLSKEMELVLAYVEIEQERFGKRLKVEFDVDESLYHCKVMPLIIEPLVENAIRHGVSRKVNGGTVRLTIREHEDLVKVVVEDDGVGMTQEQVSSLFVRRSQGQGIGLKNMARRLKHLNGQTPIINSTLGHGTKVTIMFPYQ